MKGLQDNNYTQISMKHEALEEYIEKQDKQYLSKVLEYAKTMAEEGRPKIGESLKRYKFTIESWYASMWQHTKKELQSSEFEQLNKHDSEYGEKNIKENKDKIAKNIHERQSHIIEKNRIVITFDEAKQPIVIAILIFTGLFVGVIDGRSLMVGLKENFLISMMWGLLIGGAISMLAKTLPRATSEWCKTIWQKRAAIIGSILLVAGLTYLIGTLRLGNTGALALSETANTATNASPLTFMIFNTFVFFVEVLMCFFLLPTHQQSLQILARKSHKKKIEALNLEIKQLETENVEITEQLNTIIKGRKQNNYYEKYLFDYIQSLSNQAWALFLSENAIRRNDDYTPETEAEEFSSIFNQKKKK